MKYISLFAIICLVVFLLYVAVHDLLINLKRKHRIGELRHHVQMIMDQNGCGEAWSHYGKAIHIIDHYALSLLDIGIDMTEYGFKGGESAWLICQVEDSQSRAEVRKKKAEVEAIQQGIFEKPKEIKENLWPIRHPANI